jgi:membrane protease YdiL (CAAX protease family)
VRAFDLRVTVVLIASALVLTFLEFEPIREAFDRPASERTLARLGYWSAGCFLAYFLAPALIVWLVFRERIRDYGLSLRGFFRHVPIYVGLYLIVAPAVVLAFRFVPVSAEVYPFYPRAREGWDEFLRWQLIYGVQFFSLEFFFRGFMIFGLEKKLGRSAILVMVVPYCMIHFRKSAIEACAAIVAGLALGLLALRTRSIFGGVLIHWAVAFTADLTVILQTGGFADG